MQARLSESQAMIEQLQLKLAQMEKAKAKAAADAADMAQQLDQAQIMNSAMEKKAKQFDRIVGEWKGKVDGLGMDLDTAQKETRNISSELFRVKNAYDESVIQLEEVRRENKVRTCPDILGMAKECKYESGLSTFLPNLHLHSAALQRNQGHHGPDQRGRTLHPRD